MNKQKGFYALILAAFLFPWATNALAEPNPITSQNVTRHIENLYTPYGVAIGSTQTITTSTTTTRNTTVNKTDKTYTSTSTTTQTVKSSWRGGSLKLDAINGSSATSGGDSSNSSLSFNIDYSGAYDDNGKLMFADKIISTTSGEGADEKGKHYVISGSEAYDITDGQALKKKSTTTYTYDSEEGAGDVNTVNQAYEYELKGGNWNLKRETSASASSQATGGTENTTTVTAYNRDENGVITGITQGKEGSLVDMNGRNPYTGAFARTPYNLQNYVATYELDPEMGWYLTKESYDWLRE